MTTSGYYESGSGDYIYGGSDFDGEDDTTCNFPQCMCEGIESCVNGADDEVSS